MRSIIKEKKGDIASIIYVVMILFSIGVVFVLMNSLNDKIFTALYKNINETSPDSSSLAVIDKIQGVDNSAWDYAFLALLMGYIIGIGMTAYATRISPIYFWIYVILSLVALMVGAILQNTWQELAANDNLTETIARFPITNFVLGTRYMLIVTGIICISLGLLFAKPPELGGGVP